MSEPTLDIRGLTFYGRIDAEGEILIETEGSVLGDPESLWVDKAAAEKIIAHLQRVFGL